MFSATKGKITRNYTYVSGTPTPVYAIGKVELANNNFGKSSKVVEFTEYVASSEDVTIVLEKKDGSAFSNAFSGTTTTLGGSVSTALSNSDKTLTITVSSVSLSENVETVTVTMAK